MILNNASLVTRWPSNPLVEGALVAIEGKTIVDFGPVGKLADRYDDAETYDVSGRIVIPGSIDALLRPMQALTIGMKRDASESLTGLDREAIFVGTVVGLMDAVRSGTTSAFALHDCPPGDNGSFELIEKAFAEVGIRGAASYALRSAGEIPAVKERLSDQLTRASETFRPLLGLSLDPSMSDEALRAVGEAAEDIGARLHVTVDGGREGFDTSLAVHALSPVQRLAKRGLLRRAGFLTHAPHRLAEDAALVRESRSWLNHCPAAEMMCGVSTSGLAHLRATETPVAVGTGREGGGVLESFRLAVVRERASGLDAESSLRLAHWAAFQSTSEMASAHLRSNLGSIRPGARADLVVLDAVPSTPLSAENLPEQLFWASGAPRVHTIIVNGRILYQNGSFVRLDEARFRARAREIARRLWEHI